MATILQHRPNDHITAVVLRQIFPSKKVEISPLDLPNYIGEYGQLMDPTTKKSHELVGVKFRDSDIVCYAGYYWYGSPWTSWHLYVGVSHAPGLKIER